MKSCPNCKSTYPTHFSVCPRDAAQLEDISELAAGTVLRGKYKILEKVGEGGMGAVYRAMHLRFDEVCAIKVVLPNMLEDPSFLQRFHAEALLMRKLDDPHALKVQDVDETEDGRPFIVMEFIDGEGLDAIIKRGPLSAARAVRIAVQACDALGAAHKLGIIHRDIKPENILISHTADGGDSVKVLDFGIAKVKAGSPLRDGKSITQTGTLVGTPAYMSPEQCQGTKGDELTGASDLYSLGVVLYSMLTGKQPFQSDSAVGMMMAHLQQQPPDPRALRADVPAQVVAVVMRALEKDPARRFASAEEMKRALEESIAQADRTQISRRSIPIPAEADLSLANTTPAPFRASPRLDPAPVPPPTPSSIAPQAPVPYAPPEPPAIPKPGTPPAPPTPSVLHARPPAAVAPEPPAPAPPPAAPPVATAAPAAPRREPQREVPPEIPREVPSSPAPQSRRGINPLVAVAGGVLVAALILLGVWITRDRGGDKDKTAVEIEKKSAPPGDSGSPSPAPPNKNPGGSVSSSKPPSSSGPSATPAKPQPSPVEIVAPQFALRGALAGHKDTVLSVAFTPGGKILASGGMDKAVALWDPATGKPLGQLTGHTGPVFAVAFSPNGKLLASASGDATVRVWEVAAGTTAFTLTGHKDRVYAVAFSPDGRMLATASKDGTVKLWDAASGGELRTLTGHNGAVTAVAFSPDGRTVASGGEDSVVLLWDAGSGTQLRALRGHTNRIHTVAFSPDGKLLASAGRDASIRLWEPDSGREVRTLKGHTGYVESVAFSRDGRLLASGSEDMTVKLWDAATGNELSTLTGPTGWVISVAFSPDGQMLAAASADKMVRVWKNER